MARTHRYGIFAAWLLILAGCDSGKSGQLHEVTGHLPDLHFTLTTDNGQVVTEQTYRGSLVMLFFGFTTCAAECPSTLFRLAEIVRRLGEDAGRPRILFVSLDPAHDTAPVLRRYVEGFDAEHATGLTGSTEDIVALTKRYRAAYRPSGAVITHSPAVYIFDTQGHARFLMTPDDATETVASDLRQLYASAPGP